MNEEWRPVIGFEGLYEVSDQGRVRSVPRMAYRRDGTPLRLKGAMKKLNLMMIGYYRVTLTRLDHTDQYLVHRLVAQAFVPNPCALPDVNHRDLDQLNNRPSNLEWVNHRANIVHPRDHGRLNGFTNRRRRLKLQPDQVREIRERALRGTETHATIADCFSVSRRFVGMIASGQRWDDSFDGMPDATKMGPE